MSIEFTVVGETRYDEVVLRSDTIKFDSDSKLILAPVEEAPTGAPRTLTIIANSIEITDQAEITYDLDGDGNIDADTPAPDRTGKAPNGSSGAPNYTPSHPNWEATSHPHAENGGQGTPGQRGERGIDGTHAPTLEIWVKDVSAGSMTINFRGQDGGRGGDGGDGGDGGGGQKGATSRMDDAWYDGEECTREPGHGGKGGRGGDAGYPGCGGQGGNGGIVKVFTRLISIPRVQSWTYIVEGGKGGDAGLPGSPGTGGPGGPQGDRVDPCPSRPEYHGSAGLDGRPMDDIDPEWESNLRGEDGADGEYGVHQIVPI